MGFRTHVLVFGLLGVAFGVGELLLPELVLHSFGVVTNASAVIMTRLGCGPLNVGFGLAAALSFRVRDPAAQRAVLTAGVAYATTATVVSLYYGLTDPSLQWMMGSMLIITVPLGGNATRLLFAMGRNAPGDGSAAVSPPATGG